ncbi:hypothetical protein ES703_77957 [subsurface metagenome]
MITKIGLYRDPRKTKQWVVRWFGEYDPATGKQKRYCKSFQRKRDAEAFQVELAMSFQGGQQRDKAEEITLKDFTEDWLKIREPEFQPPTIKVYENAIARLLDYFGENMLLSKITPRLAGAILCPVTAGFSAAKSFSALSFAQAKWTSLIHLFLVSSKSSIKVS